MKNPVQTLKTVLFSKHYNLSGFKVGKSAITDNGHNNPIVWITFQSTRP